MALFREARAGLASPDARYGTVPGGRERAAATPGQWARMKAATRGARDAPLTSAGRRAPRDGERVVAALDPVEAGVRSDAGDDVIEQGAGREGVVPPLQEQHRHRDSVEVFVADLLGPARRVQGVSEKHDAGYRHPLRHGHGRHPPAERLARRPDGPGAASGRRLHRRTPRGDRGGRTVGHPPSGLGVGEVEPQRRHTLVGDGLGESHEERMPHVRSGAVRHDDRRGRLTFRPFRPARCRPLAGDRASARRFGASGTGRAVAVQLDRDHFGGVDHPF